MGKKLVLGQIEKDSPIGMLVAQFDLLSIDPSKREKIAQCLAGALGRLQGDGGEYYSTYFANIQNHATGNYDPELAKLVKDEGARETRINYLLENEPEGGWRIASGVEGDEESLFRIKHPIKR